jgi:hypothetical protein
MLETHRDDFINFPPHSYSCDPPHSHSHALPHTSSHALPQFAYEPNHSSYSFGSQENYLEPIRFGYDTHPYRGDHFSCMPSFPIGGSHTHLEPRHLDGPHFPCRGSRPTWSNDVVQKIVKTSSGRMVKC